MNYRDDDYRAEREALTSRRRALERRDAGHDALTFALTVVVVAAAVVVIAWGIG